jgi:hypothetical protein
MSVSENFMTRWSRLKRESEKENKTEPAGSAPPPDAVETAAADKDETTAVQPGRDVPDPQDFDLASLPPIESISVGTDIRSFLQAGIPAELTRAALRRAWVSEPAIRDFIGIAENQWDFTDPTAIPGFGPLRATDDVRSLVAQALGKLDEAPETIAEISASAEQAVSAIIVPRRSGSDDEIGQTPSIRASGPAGSDIPGSDVAAEDKSAAAECGPGRNHRSHGGALPR